MVKYKYENKIKVPFTAEEQPEYDDRQKAWPDDSANRKLINIKEIRLEKLNETDYLANSDMVMTDEMKAYRQGMRDIPQNNSTEEQYDLILARDENRNLTHEIWSKP